ncbi:endonuclease [candidate division MSBL1 archaeon SCGC-AAA382N08]|uniref:Flap endonuclease 1 n=1 Tax=candidate division MSBL1 archaeon SCGC-AAA382N08 TaxID=1698285 RepID=A0A133VNN8_9EURY|nr:endonuclease [candidate division MSBL1 archaeon SCGC-AAA382N08]
MGVKIKEILPFREVELDHFHGREIAIDAMNTLYQFLSTIRQYDGTPLKDSEGRVTSHLSGLFYRTSNLVEIGIKPLFVFDGEPPKLKSKTIENRRQIRAEAEKARKKALEKGKKEEARKYAQRSASLSSEMIGQSKTLLSAMGIPWVQAPGEGEAQASRIIQNGDAWGTGSQDFDSLLYGSPVLVRNLTITGKRKLPGKDKYKQISPEVFEIEKIFEKHDIDRKKLIAIGILVGTDYNEGIKGIGPNKALKRVKEDGDIEEIIESADKVDVMEVDPLEIEKLFLEPDVTDDYSIKWAPPNPEEIKRFLCEKHDFSESRVETGIERLEKGVGERAQESLEKWT